MDKTEKQRNQMPVTHFAIISAETDDPHYWSQDPLRLGQEHRVIAAGDEATVINAAKDHVEARGGKARIVRVVATAIATAALWSGVPQTEDVRY